MDDERAAEALIHLQRAVRELIAAARLGLDVIEEIVDQVAATIPAATMAAGARDDVPGSSGPRPAPVPDADEGSEAAEATAVAGGSRAAGRPRVERIRLS